MKGITMVKIDEYVDRRLEEKVEAVKSYIDLKIAELNGGSKALEGKFSELQGRFERSEGQYKSLEGQYKGLEGQMQGLRDSFEGLRSEVRASVSEMRAQYNLITTQYNEVMGLLRIVIERTNPDKIGFGAEKGDRKWNH